MLAFVFVIVVCGGLAGYLVGRHQQRYAQARVDVVDLRGKLTKARKARWMLRSRAYTSWAWLVAALAFLVVVSFVAGR